MIEHDGCKGCDFEDLNTNEHPCVICKGNLIPCTAEFNSATDYYQRNRTCNKQADMVNHPPHYTSGSIECIDAMRSAFGDSQVAVYCKINAFKYLWRADQKNGFEDLKKAQWYIDKCLEIIREVGIGAMK